MALLSDCVDKQVERGMIARNLRQQALQVMQAVDASQLHALNPDVAFMTAKLADALARFADIVTSRDIPSGAVYQLECNVDQLCREAFLVIAGSQPQELLSA